MPHTVLMYFFSVFYFVCFCRHIFFLYFVLWWNWKIHIALEPKRPIIRDTVADFCNFPHDLSGPLLYFHSLIAHCVQVFAARADVIPAAQSCCTCGITAVCSTSHELAGGWMGVLEFFFFALGSCGFVLSPWNCGWTISDPHLMVWNVFFGNSLAW